MELPLGAMLLVVSQTTCGGEDTPSRGNIRFTMFKGFRS
jgi:hypothetical protein